MHRNKFYKSRLKLKTLFLIYLRRVCSNRCKDGQIWNIDRRKQKTDIVQYYKLYNYLPTVLLVFTVVLYKKTKLRLV